VWLVSQPAKRRRRVRAEALDHTTWVVRRGRGPAVHRIGPPLINTHLVVDEEAARSHMPVYERSVLHFMADEHVAWMLRRMKVNCVLDVGANRGQYAKKLRRHGYTGRIVSFEPVPHVADRLEKAASDDDDWHVVRCALGEARAETEIEVAGGQGRMSSLLPPSDFGKAWTDKLGSQGTVTVPVRRLDELFDDVVDGLDDPRVYLKLDTQGFDLQAFAGAGDRIDDVLCMQSEVSVVPLYEGMPPMTEQLAVYESAGFELTGMFPVVSEATTMRVIEFDAMMVRVDALPD
jgi:FkbM family methyltransferase